MSKLLPNEEILFLFGENVILTDQQVKMSYSSWGQSYKIAIFHENISSIEAKFKSYVIYIFLAALGLLYCVFRRIQGFEIDEQMFAPVGISIFFFLVWWFTRKHIVSIASDGGARLNVEAHGMHEDQIDNFIYSVSEAKQKRIGDLAGRSLKGSTMG